MNNRRLVFVGGLHRSGTTLLARALAAHPDIVGFSHTGVVEDEGQYLQSVYPSDAISGGAGRFGFDARAHLTEASPLATAANADRLWAEWRSHWPAEGLWYLEKSPASLIRARFLQALFPEASFVLITRHPVAVALATRKWSRTGIYALLHHWVHCHGLLDADLSMIRRCCIVSYEEFSAFPAEVLRVIHAFLQLDPYPPAIPVLQDVNATYFRVWREEYGVRHRDRGTADFDPCRRDHLTFGQRVRNALDRRACRFIEKWPGGGRRAVSLADREAQDAVEIFEAGVNLFGYSLLELNRYPRARVQN